uniref:AIG1-type G domain-containing protein n=1 Tax=Sinocyclocheilus grahami TaxID=75366 RepID=A0A672MCG3_SINGR
MSELRNSPNSETCEVHEANVDKKSMEIIDTPGLIDASKEKMKKDEIEKFVCMSAPGPHVFLLVIRLDTRFTDEKKNTEKWIQENIGEDAVHHTIILFTHADLLKGKSLDEYIRERPYLQSLVHRCGDRSHPFNCQDRNNPNQVTELLEKIENMAEANGWRYYTNQMFKEILNRKVRRLRNASVAIGSAGVAAIITGGAVLGATTLVAAPALVIAGGGLAVVGGIGIYKKIKLAILING